MGHPEGIGAVQAQQPRPGIRDAAARADETAAGELTDVFYCCFVCVTSKCEFLALTAPTEIGTETPIKFLRRRPSAISTGAQDVDHSFKYPAARVLSDSCTVFTTFEPTVSTTYLTFFTAANMIQLESQLFCARNVY